MEHSCVVFILLLLVLVHSSYALPFGHKKTMPARERSLNNATSRRVVNGGTWATRWDHSIIHLPRGVGEEVSNGNLEWIAAVYGGGAFR